MLDALLQLDHIDAAAIAPLMASAAVWGWALLTAFVRLLGLLVMSPVFGHRTVSLWLRVGLAGCLAPLVMPVLVSRSLVWLPANGVDAALHLGGEFALGALLGFGVLFLFAGLKLAGELIDQQAGTTVQEVIDPHGGDMTSVSGQLLTLVGTLAFLSITPGNGHLSVVSALLDSFTAVPAGVLWSGDGLLRLLADLGQASLTLGLQVAAPVLAAGAIVSWGVAQLGGSSGGPSGGTLLGLPSRVVVSLGVLAMVFSGATDALLTSVDSVLTQFLNLRHGA